MKPIRKYELRTYKTPNGVDQFQDWFKGLDRSWQIRIDARLERIQNGNLGDCKAVGGVFELRFKRPAYRIYFAILGDVVLLLLCAGDKRTQSADILRARKYLDGVKGK